MAKRITVIGAGGTLAMTNEGSGLQPARSAADLAGAVRGLVGDVQLSAVDAFSKSSANLGFADVELLARLVAQAADGGADGVVITQGTDTIEETAFALELMLERRIPVVVTGGMRGASAPGADGPANLIGAVTAARLGSADVGVMVVINDEVHAARHVSKRHTTAMDAFGSGEAGPIGRLHEGELRLRTAALPAIGVPMSSDAPWPRVALIKLSIDDDGALIDAVASGGFQGCVVEAMGAGHAPAALAPRLGALAQKMPVILSSRTGDGAVCRRTYGYPGSETDLLARGLVWGGALQPLKARVLLAVCLRRSLSGAAEAFGEVAALI